MDYNMEIGLIMCSLKLIWGEFYSNVVFVRNGICNVIVYDLCCFGEKKYIRMWVGCVSKIFIFVLMCFCLIDIKKIIV